MARKVRSEESQARRFGVILSVLLLALAGYLAWRDHGLRVGLAAGAAAAVLTCTLAAFPIWLWAFRYWMKLAEALGWVMTRVLLSVFFYLALTPMAILMRLFGKRPLDLAWRDGRTSTWIDKPAPESTIERYQRQF